MADTDFQKFLFSKANDSVKTSLNHFQKLYEQSDRIVVWLVGFSITAITLLIANFESTNPLINKISGVMVIFSGLTILFGILYRIFHFLFQKSELELIISFDQFVEGYNLPENHIFSKYITAANTSYREILILIDQDFGIPLPMHDLSKMSPGQQQKIHEEVATRYNELQENRMKFEVELFEENIAQQLGRESISTNKKKNSNKLVWKYLKITNVLFISTCITFLLGIIVLITMYFIYRC